MNDVLAMAVFRDYERTSARLNAGQGAAPVTTRVSWSPREQVAAVLLALAAWIAPATPAPAALPSA